MAIPTPYSGITQQQYYNGNDFGGYQFVSLNDIINQFMIVYVGEDKLISKASRVDVAFHAQRGLAEMSFDTLKSTKAQEITLPPSLQMILPQDYVNYTKVSWVDSAGIKHLIYPTSKTSNPSLNPLQDDDGNFILQGVATLGTIKPFFQLDKEYKDIVVGMLITGPYIPPLTFVAGTSIVFGTTQTQVHMHDSLGADVLATQGNSGTTLTFTNHPDGSLLLPQKEAYIVENLSWNLTDYKITGTASELTDIKIGMIVSHEDFPIGTVVTNVHGTTIVVDQLPVVVSAAVPPDGEITFISSDLVDTDTWSNYKSGAPSENQDDYQDDTYWPMDGSRFGLDPQHSQANGSFYVDNVGGKIHFSSNISGKTVILDYISDSLGDDGEMQVHKFAEEAMYKWMSHAILSGKSNIPEYQVNRLKKERFAAVRTAKLRLSNIKLEELTQILRGKSKQIKH